MSDNGLNCPPGPRFFRDDDGNLMFEFTADARTRIGPRLATDLDVAAFPNAAGAELLTPFIDTASLAAIAEPDPVKKRGRPRKDSA